MVLNDRMLNLLFVYFAIEKSVWLSDLSDCLEPGETSDLYNAFSQV